MKAPCGRLSTPPVNFFQHTCVLANALSKLYSTFCFHLILASLCDPSGCAGQRSCTARADGSFAPACARVPYGHAASTALPRERQLCWRVLASYFLTPANIGKSFLLL